MISAIKTILVILVLIRIYLCGVGEVVEIREEYFGIFPSLDIF